MKRLALPLMIAATPLFALSSAKTKEKTSCFPENNLHLEDRIDRKDANITKANFNEIITSVISYYKPVVAKHNATLTIDRKWDDGTVNAYAQQSGSTWNVAMFGGLARRPEVTPDGFAMVVCHEVGHHLAGFPFYDEGWASSEGQSDYFATQACATNIWENELEVNATFRGNVPAIVAEKCDSVYSETDRQNLCYRTSMAGKSLGELLSALGNGPVPQFETPDPKVVESTVPSHPAGQCRLDTYFNGALCSNVFDEDLIPGRGNADGQQSIDAERIASMKSCTNAGFYNVGKRANCWYAPKLSLSVNSAKATQTEAEGNGDGVWQPGETAAINLPLANNLLAAIEGATLTINQPGFASSTYPSIGVGETAFADEAIKVLAPATSKCGDPINLAASVAVGDWKNDFTLQYILGENPRVDHVGEEEVLPIPDGRGSLDRVLAATVDARTSKVKVDLNITHSYIGDLKVSVVSPAGNTYMIHDGAGRGTDDIKKVFDVAVNNELIKGNWTLTVRDTARQDSGKLNSWAINFTALSCDSSLAAK